MPSSPSSSWASCKSTVSYCYPLTDVFSSVTIASVVRLVILVQGLFGLVTSSDPTFNIGFVVSAIETNLALITASAPALRPFFRDRDRGGWLGRSSVAPTKSRDVEEATSKPFGWPLSAKRRSTTPKSPVGGGVNKLLIGRGSSRGGRRGGSRSGRGRGGAKKYDIRLRRDNVGAELRSRSPRASEEETMTANGIMRVSDIQREFDGIVREIAVEGSGTYTGRAAVKTTTTSSPPPSRRGDRPATAPRLLTTTNLGSINTARPATRDSNINDFRNTGFDFFNRIPPPETETVSTSRGRQQFPTERYYSESVYPEIEYYAQQRRDDRDYGEERISKYGEKRFGVVTPRGGVTPTSGNGWRESGRPF